MRPCGLVWQPFSHIFYSLLLATFLDVYPQRNSSLLYRTSTIAGLHPAIIFSEEARLVENYCPSIIIFPYPQLTDPYSLSNLLTIIGLLHVLGHGPRPNTLARLIYPHIGHYWLSFFYLFNITYAPLLRNVRFLCLLGIWKSNYSICVIYF